MGKAKEKQKKGSTAENEKVAVGFKEPLPNGDSQNGINWGSGEDTISFSQLKHLLNRDDLPHLLDGTNIIYRKLLNTIMYEEELEKLQVELVKMQRWVQDEGHRIAIIFEGRDAAGLLSI